MKEKRIRSLRARLSLTLLGAALAVACAIGLLAYRNTLQENEQLFDYQLRQTALSLRDQGIAAVSPLLPDQDNTNVVVQIWTADGTTLYLSHPGASLPDRATLGFSDVQSGNQRWRVFSMLLHDRVIQVAQPFQLRRDLAATAALRSLRPLLAFVPLMALLIWWLVGTALRPVQRLAREVTRRDANALEPVSEQALPSEIAPVAHALNSLLARLSQSFSVQRAFVADAAHELRSPLTALKLQLQVLGRAGDDAGRAEALQKLNDGVDRASRLIEQLLTAARTEPGGPPVAFASVNLAEQLRLSMASVFAQAQERRIAIEADAPETLAVAGDDGLLQILLRNLLENAVRYTPEGGQVRAAAQTTTSGALLEVEDSGPGIPEAERERVFERFYRGTQTAHAGSGLGLAIVANIARRHGATVALGTSSLGGLKISVLFPARS